MTASLFCVPSAGPWMLVRGLRLAAAIVALQACAKGTTPEPVAQDGTSERTGDAWREALSGDLKDVSPGTDLTLADLVVDQRLPDNSDSHGPCEGVDLSAQGCWPECDDMVKVPAGEFWMGCDPGEYNDCEEWEMPMHLVYLDEYEIDRVEVTIGEYIECEKNGACSIHLSNVDDQILGFNLAGDAPMFWATWENARTYCEWEGKRLPTEAEWEKAARSDDRRRYPWGDEPPDCCLIAAVMNPLHCFDSALWLLPVGSRPLGASPYGALDMLGSAGEWVEDVFDPTFYAESPYYMPVNSVPSADAHTYCHVIRDPGAQLYSLTDGFLDYVPKVWLRGCGTETAPFLPWAAGFRCAR